MGLLTSRRFGTQDTAPVSLCKKRNRKELSKQTILNSIWCTDVRTSDLALGGIPDYTVKETCDAKLLGFSVADGRSPNVLASGRLMTDDSVRENHYCFAHYALPAVAFADPLRFFSVLGSDTAKEFLIRLWENVTEKCETGPNLKCSKGSFQIHTFRIKRFPTAVVVMPRAEALAEAHMVAAILTEDLDSEKFPDKPGLRYFTLELGENLDGSVRTVLGEWSEGGHANYGDGPNADVADFAERLEQLI